MKPEKARCIICKHEFNRRVKGMKDRAYRISLRPYRCLTCSEKCAVLYNRMPLNKRDLLKIQGGIRKVNEFIPEALLGEDFQLCLYDGEEKDWFGYFLQSEEKHNSQAKKGSLEEYYHDVFCQREFKSRENFEIFKKGLKLIGDAISNEIVLGEEEE